MRIQSKFFWTLAVAMALLCFPAGAQMGGAPAVSVMTIEPGTVPVRLEFLGVTEAAKVVEVRSRVTGFLETRSFQEGAIVQKGEELFRIDPRPFEADLDIAQARVAQAEARATVAERKVNRYKSVSPGTSVITENELDDLLAEQTNAQAALRLAEAERAKAELQLGYTTVTAPLTGYIGKALRDIGSVVDEGTNGLLAIVHQVDPIYVSFQISERDYLDTRRRVSEGIYELSGVENPYLEIQLLDGTRYPYDGVLDFEDTSLALSTGTLAIRATFANPERYLKPGQFVEAAILGYVRHDVITVPQRAVSSSPQGTYVYVVGVGDVAEQRIVEAGGWVGQDWVIGSGLSAGERVVVDGVVKVQPGIEVSPSPAAPASAK